MIENINQLHRRSFNSSQSINHRIISIIDHCYYTFSDTPNDQLNHRSFNSSQSINHRILSIIDHCYYTFSDTSNDRKQQPVPSALLQPLPVNQLLGNPYDGSKIAQGPMKKYYFNVGKIKCFACDSYSVDVSIYLQGYEPQHGKTNNLHRRKQRRRSASR